MFGVGDGPLGTTQTVASCEFLDGVFGVEKLQSLCVFEVEEGGIPMLDVKNHPRRQSTIIRKPMLE